MENPYAKVLAYMRRFLYKERKHLAELMLDKENNKGYITFKSGKIYGLQIAIENIERLKSGADIPMDKIND